MDRNPSYSENNDWENANQSPLDNSNRQPYFGNHPGNYRHDPGRNQGYPQNRESASGPGYGPGYGNPWNQGHDRGYENPQSNRNPFDDFRGAYRLDTTRNEAGYQQLHERNFGPDYGYGHAGNSRTGGDYGRHQSDYGTAGTYGASRNAGSMGSYGGAQGYGSSSNGYSSEKWGSGHQGAPHQPHHTVYGAYRDKNSFAPGEKESYDGSQRSGSQGADNTRGWTNPGRSGRSGSYQHRTSDDDARYEIYDTASSHYDRGGYGNYAPGTSISDELNLRSHQNYSPRDVYGSRQRGRRQGTGSDLDRNLGTDMDYQNTAGSLSVGYDGFRGEPAPENRYYDPLTGEIRNRNFDR